MTSLSQELDNKVQEGIYSRPDGYKCFVADLKKVEERYHQEPRKGIMVGKGWGYEIMVFITHHIFFWDVQRHY